MQAALPLGPSVSFNTYGITAALLVGITVLPKLLTNNVSTNGYESASKSLEEPKLEVDSKSKVLPNTKELTRSLEEEPVEQHKPKLLKNPQKPITSDLKQISRQELIDDALTWIGVPYLWGGESRTGVDCSALVQKIYSKYGISLPRTSREQFRQGIGVALENLLPGDLVFFSTNGPGASHVGLYLGNGKFLSATRRQVEIQTLDIPYWKKSYRGSRRVVP